METTHTTMREANRNRIRRALDHLKAASVVLGNMNGKDMTYEYNAQRDKCLEEVSRAYNAVDNFRYIVAQQAD